MKMILFGLLLLGFTEAQKCKKYNCDKNYTEGTCAVWDYDQVNLTMCNPDLICVFPYQSNNKAVCMDSTKHPSRLPGEYCDDPFECLYNKNCIENICRGKSVGEFCQSDGECDIELYCYNEKCKEPTDDCKEEKTKCKSNQICSNEKCVYMGQLDNFEKASVPSACKSFYVHNEQCRIGPKLVPSDREGFCKYLADDGQKIYTIPLCTLNNPSVTFCPPGRGNVNMESVSSCIEY